LLYDVPLTAKESIVIHILTMSSDKDVLLSMGFDPARVEWALKATGNRGLQPAMDHILEHEGQPVPDPSSQQAAPASSTPGDMDVDDDDAEALRAAMGKASANIAPAAGSSDAEAKVRAC
jgi:UBX domain-containing protein 1/4